MTNSLQLSHYQLQHNERGKKEAGQRKRRPASFLPLALSTDQQPSAVCQPALILRRVRRPLYFIAMPVVRSRLSTAGAITSKNGVA
jgi:hypothetical protein